MTVHSLQLDSEGIAKVKEISAIRQLTRAEISTRYGVGRTSVSKFFNGKAVNEQIFIRPCEVFNLDWKEVSGSRLNNKNGKNPQFKQFRRSPSLTGRLRLITEILADFGSVLSGQNETVTETGEVDYISCSNYIKLLDHFAPGFDWEIRTHLQNQIVVVEGKLTIKAKEGNFVREGIGCAEIGSGGHENAINNAEVSALRQCCVKFQLDL